MIPVVAKVLKDMGVKSYVTSLHVGVKTTLTASGPKPEGQPFSRYADTKTAAIEAYIEELRRFLDKSTVVFWTQTPELVIEQAPLISKKPMPLYQVISRLTACEASQFHELGETP